MYFRRGPDDRVRVVERFEAELEITADLLEPAPRVVVRRGARVDGSPISAGTSPLRMDWIKAEAGVVTFHCANGVGRYYLIGYNAATRTYRARRVDLIAA